MKIRPNIKQAMETLKIEKLRKNQLKPINAILDGYDTMVIAPTSFGKSLIYLIPAIIHQDKLTVVVEPLLALMHDQVQRLRSLGIAAAYLDSTQSKSERSAVMEQLRARELHILYIAPERLETGILPQIEDTSRIGMIVVDECHCVVAWGDTFREAYRFIGESIGALKHRPVITALSATAFPEDRPRIAELLNMHEVRYFEMSLYRSNLRLMKKVTPSRRLQIKALKKCMKKYHCSTTMIFCDTKRAVEYVAGYLEELYPGEVAAYHSQSKKQERQMLSGEKHIIVATSALSMGVDVRDVDLVIHFNMPMSLADYYQMAGRAGREGQPARSILLYNSDDYYINRGLLEDIEEKSAKKRAMRRLDAMKEFCEDDERCMVTDLLNALGDPRKKNCRYCTNCQKGR